MKFDNPQHALRWAYETINKRDDEHHDEASLLLNKCEDVLPPLHFAYIRVQFGREVGGFELLSAHLASNFGLHSRMGIELIIRAHSGEKIGLREIRKALGSGMLKAASLRNRGYDLLDVIHEQVMEALRRELDARGLILE